MIENNEIKTKTSIFNRSCFPFLTHSFYQFFSYYFFYLFLMNHIESVKAFPALEFDLSTGDGFTTSRIIGNKYSQIGKFITPVGDINQDGINDLVIGSNGNTYLLYGGLNRTDLYLSHFTETEGVIFPHFINREKSGTSVASAGDVNGDGFKDILIGAPDASFEHRFGAGRVYLKYGGPSLASLDLEFFNETQGVIIKGANSADKTGTAVSSAGDINEDGFDDIIIGAPNANPLGRTNAGITHIIFGGVLPGEIDLATMNATQGVLIQGAQARDRIGYQVESAGDVNGDSIPDILISAPYASPFGRIEAGSCYVLYGGKISGIVDLANLTLSQGISIQGGANGDLAGSSISAGRDVNGDGLSDILIGAPGVPLSWPRNAGSTFLIYGQNFTANIDLGNLNITQGVAIYGSSSDDGVGTSVALAGDLNDDGYDEVITVSRSDAFGGSIIYLLHGGNLTETVDLALFNATAQGARITQLTLSYLSYNSVSSIGDINQDNITDLFIDCNLGGDRRFLLIIYGNGLSGATDLEVVPHLLIEIFPPAVFTNALAFADDMDRDGIPDILIGNPRASPQGRLYAGQTFLLYGKALTQDFDVSALNASQGIFFDGARSDDFTIDSAAGIGDFNGDGVDDLLLGASKGSPQGLFQAGRAFLIYGGISSGTVYLHQLNATQGVIFEGAVENEGMATAVSTAGDFNGDGLADLLIGSYFASAKGRNAAGKTFLIFGNISLPDLIKLENLTMSQGIVIAGASMSASSAYSLAPAGDINRDNYTDILITAPFTPTGSAYVLFGKSLSEDIDLADIDATLGVVIEGEWTNGSPYYVASAKSIGDVNDDGYPDIMVGVPNARPGPLNAGVCYVIYGGNLSANIHLPSFNSAQGVVIHGQGIESGLGIGHFLSTLGKANDDNVPDFLIGSPNAADLDNDEAGVLYVLFGGAFTGVLDLAFLNIAQGLKVIGPYANAKIGDSIALADVDGDSFSEIFIGSQHESSTTAFLSDEIYVIYNEPILLIKNAVITFNDQPTLVTFEMLDAQYAINLTADIQYFMRDITEGHFEILSNPGVAVNTFYQSQITQGTVRFLPDGNQLIPSFTIQLQVNSKWAWSAWRANVIFDYTPILSPLKTFRITMLGESIPVTESQLLLTDQDDTPDELFYSINSRDHVWFAYNHNTSEPIDSFTQSEVNAREMVFVHDASMGAMGFTFTYSDGLYVSSLQSGLVELDLTMNDNETPVIQTNAITIHEGEKVILTSIDLSATDANDPEESLQFSVFDVVHGQFERVDTPGVRMTSFTQQDILDGAIAFQHDGSESAPEYFVVVSDGKTQTSPSAAKIHFTASQNDAPSFALSEWVVLQGESFLLTPDVIQATDSDNAPNELIFQVRAIQQGGFYRLGESAPLLLFSQQDINDEVIEFRHDGADVAPTVTLAVNDGQITTDDQSVKFRFIKQSDSLSMISPQAQDSGIVFTGMGAGFVCLAACLSAGFFVYHKQSRAKWSREGDDNLIPKTVYAKLKVNGASNFRSAEGQRFVEQIQDLFALYQKRFGEYKGDKVRFGECLAEAIQKTCNLHKDRFNQTRLLLSDDEQASPLKIHADTIVRQTQRNLQSNTTSLTEIDKESQLPSVETGSELTLFPLKSPRKSPRSPRGDGEERHRRSRSGSHSAHAGRSRAESRRSRRVSVSMNVLGQP